MKKILIVSAVSPLPINNGKRVVMNGVLNYLKDRGYSIHYLYLGEENTLILPDEVVYTCMPMSSAIKKIKNIIVYSFLKKEKSFQEAVMWNENNIHIISNTLKKIKPDIIMVDTIRMGQYFCNEQLKNIKACIYFDDLFSIRYEKMLFIKKKFPQMVLNPLGNFCNNLPKAMTWFLKSDFIETQVLKFERKLVRNSEMKQAQRFARGYLINNNEVNILSELIIKNNIFEIPPYLARDNCFKQHIYDGNDEFVFLGSLNISHNQISIINFIEKNAEILKSIYPKCKVRIIGGNANDELKHLVEKYKDIFTLEGYVEDLDNILTKSCAMIIPLIFGTGVKLKTIEAMYYGLPIITTYYGVEGVHVDESSVILEEDIKNFAYHMKYLSNVEINKTYSELISKQYKDNYTKSAVYKKYDKMFSERL